MKRIGLAILIIIIAVLLLTEGVLIPKQLQPDALPLRFVEYQNETTLSAVFEMINNADAPVVVWGQVQLAPERKEEQRSWIDIERTVIPEDEFALLNVPVSIDGDWPAAFSVARFGTRQQRRFEAGKAVKGTVVYSDVVPNYAPHK